MECVRDVYGRHKGFNVKFPRATPSFENDMRDVVSAVGSRLIENNERNTQQENALSLLDEAVLGLREELEESKKNNQQLHEKQMRMEQRMEEERNKANGEIRKNISSVQTQKDRWQGGSRFEQADVSRILI